MKYDLIVENWNKFLNEQEAVATTSVTDVQTASTVEKPKDIPQSEEEKKQTKTKSIKDLAQKYINDIKRLTKQLGLDYGTISTEISKMTQTSGITEAKKKKKSGDRCTRIAKRKYDVWPSAYASGAVVKCRQGKIWKGISEDMSDEQIDDALLLESISNLKESKNQKPIIYPNFQGMDYADNKSGVVKTLKVKDCIGNEPNKDYKYFTTDKKDYVKGIIDSVNKNGIDVLPPVKAIKHPLLVGKYLVIDGNHRLGAYVIGKIPEIKAEVLNEDDIELATPDTKWKEGVVPETMNLKQAKDENVDLKKYFNIKQLKANKTDKLEEEWSQKYKRSINCKNPKGFSQKAHCQGRKK